MYRLLAILLCLPLCASSIHAQTDSVRTYTKEHPLVYETAGNWWPYSFTNDNGELEGFNIDLFRLLMSKLDIPYVIKTKPYPPQADLTLSLISLTNGKYRLHSRHDVLLLTQSVATPKGKAVTVKNFRDLNKSGQLVTICDSSLCFQLMTDYGWSEHAVVSSDISEAIRQLSTDETGQIVWNTLSLKWLIKHHQLDNIALTPVNMPHGEYTYMSNDQHLLDLIDRAYSELCADNALPPLEEKWFYPDDETTQTLSPEWLMNVIALLLIIALLTFLVHSFRQHQRATARQKQLSDQLKQVTDSNKVRIWIYDVKEQTFIWHDENRTATCPLEEFGRRYSREDFAQLKEALSRLINRQKDAKGHEEQEETLELKAKDPECGDNELHDFVVDITVTARDDSGMPTVILGTKKDITREHQLKRENNERSLRYWSIFYSDKAGIIQFGKDGYLLNANPKAGEMFQFDIDQSIEEHVHLNTILHTDFDDLSQVDGHRSSLNVGPDTIEYQIKTVCNDKKELIGIFVFCV